MAAIPENSYVNNDLHDEVKLELFANKYQKTILWWLISLKCQSPEINFKVISLKKRLISDLPKMLCH